MTSLPVAAVLPELLTALKTAPQVLLSAPTGAGKSTWLPLQLLQLLQQGPVAGKILQLEPRRLAARNVAQRLAEALNEKPGETVGYRMRAQSCVGPRTRLEVVTEGVLTRMIQRDPELRGVGLVILDEFHERSLQADLALALLLDIQQGLRDDLRLLIMSATLDNDRLCQRLPDAPTIVSEGRAFPVERRYQPLAAHLRFDEAVAMATAELLRHENGSLLLFLPGVGEIQRVHEHLASRVGSDVLLCPLYGALSLEAQRKAIVPAPAGMRKVVLATNIAETSLTIEGIRLVVDSAQERVARFDARTGLTRLVTQRISQASMTQRAGRAGRLAPGICLHLLAKEQAERAAAQSDPEILHSDLSGLLMEVLQWGCHDPASLFWLDRPPEVNLQAARRLLLMLGALEGERLSARGRKMAAMGNDPRLAAMLVNAGEGDSAATAAMLAAILEDPPRGGGTDLSVLFSRRQPGWQQRSQQLLKRLQVRNGEPDSALIMPLLARAFSDRIARRRGQEGRYQLANGMGAMLDADDALGRHEWLIAPLLLQGSASPDARILLAQPLDIASLIQACPDLLRQSDTVEWDEVQGTLKAWRRMRIGQLTVNVQPLAKPSEEELHQAMLNGIRDKGLAVLNWTPEAEQFRLRLHCAAKWLPEYDWPAVDEASLLATLENWLLPHMTGVQSLRSLKSLNVTQALRGLLDYAMLQRLDSELPGHYTVPTGSRITIRYHEDNPPALAVRMQEMFGEAKTPTIAQGRVPLVLELLSPAQRPLQITRDLSAFWQGAYREVQKEMKGRYPKHVWPDDPANTAPTRRTKKYS
ncbi:ATP-dependent helicase HrpB [Salmonella enterica subsp. enterica serovar Johannesburg]|uniref:ATP-dependent helicase HrpB n=1 Tax=Salmonella enterica subsp. enterica serovar Johannesburg TaxID=913076 RepID=A0A6C8WGJ3_SALET|nr:ATP-dependent helicase HrpB [Salmonella enterica]EHP1128112.1 ATP-dependent helicase HrpB [Salmonella enterica subsp. enterica]EFT1927039.1 ATP-dependent helicase HrpB [Salmonella enterica subsp. enterica serovar Johannesburg]EFT2714229.1 ATP-dependent helicase HrpB [Salmonella enterica subsp. enterica serovar Johannesburg]EFT8543124.1 ATP-dependent helicase HrpB [Salmonella enterica subsp. enterica serovar Johannesburg]EFU0675862.1 ATP-dependent helicase HrpB [Salmonella enterica subsp. en